MTFDDLFEWRLKMPELSRDALILLAFIAYRMNITSMSDKDGKYIFLTGLNDPTRAMGYSRSQYEKAKAHLKAFNLIEVKKQGVCQPGKVYLTLEKYTPYLRNRGNGNGGIEEGGHNTSKTEVITPRIPRNASYIKVNRKESRKVNSASTKKFHPMSQSEQIAELERLIAIETEKERKAKHDKE